MCNVLDEGKKEILITLLILPPQKINFYLLSFYTISIEPLLSTTLTYMLNGTDEDH